MISVHKAERRKAKLRLAISGSSGTGKTYSALLVARGLVGDDGRILMIDTERGSGELYANLTDYDIATLEPPYTTEKYIEAITFAEGNGYDCIILDSISHAWAGEGGLLEQVDQISSRSGNKFSSWSTITPKHQRFIDAMLRCKIHLIATMRSKTEYVLVQDANGKNKPEKRSMAPVQRDGIDYEFTVVFDLAPNHTAEATKDRTGRFQGLIFVPDKSIGGVLREWLESGNESPVIQEHGIPASVQSQVIQNAAESGNRVTEPVHKYAEYEVESIRRKYKANGWSERIFDEARYDAITWDKDMITADYKKRLAAESQNKVAEKPSATGVSGGTGSNVDNISTVENPNPESNPEQKSESKPKNPADERIKCADCGKNVLDKEADKSIKRYGVPLCPSCYVMRLTDDAAKTANRDEFADEFADEMESKKQEQEQKPETEMKESEPEPKKPETKKQEPESKKPESNTQAQVCSVCGKPLTSQDILFFKLFGKKASAPMCKPCLNNFMSK